MSLTIKKVRYRYRESEQWSTTHKPWIATGRLWWGPIPLWSVYGYGYDKEMATCALRDELDRVSPKKFSEPFVATPEEEQKGGGE